MAETVNTELIRGHVDTFILRTLVLGDSYPYDILKQISEKTQGRYELKQATLYSCMKRLEKNGLITSYWGDQSDGGRRKYYSLTDLGKELLEKDQAEWEYSRTIINNLLSDKDFDLKNDKAPFEASNLRPLTRRVKTVEDDVEIEEKDQEVLVSTPYMMHKDESLKEEMPPSSLFEYYQKKEEEELDKQLQEQHAKAIAATINNQDIEDKLENYTNKPTELSIEEARQRDEASKLLQIGNFSKPMSWDSDLDTMTPSIDEMEETNQILNERNQNESYISKLDSLYIEDNEDVIDNFEVVQPIVSNNEANQLNLIQFNDLRNSMLQKGYRLRLYNRPSELSRKYLKYIYANKLMRDSYIALFLPLLVTYIVAMSIQTFDSLAVNIILGFAVLLVPILPTIIWFRNPDKRTRDDYLFSHDIITRLIIALILMIIIFLVLMFGFDSNIAEAPAKYIISWFFALMIPLYSVIYQLLLKRKTYYLDK